MNILFLTSLLPGKNSGGHIGTRNFFDYFCSRFHDKISLVSLIRNEDLKILPQYTEYFKSKVNQFDYFLIDRKRSVVNYICSFLKMVPLSIYRNYKLSIKRKIKQIIFTSHFDLIVCNYLIMSVYIPSEYYIKTVLIDHNAEFMIWKRFAQINNNLILKILIKYEAFRMLKYETNVCRKFRLIMAASKDIECLKQYVPNSEFFEVHHLGNDELLRDEPVKNKKNNRLLFIGRMTWEPNRDGICWFLKHIYQKVKEKSSNVTLDIVGKYDSSFLEDTIDPSIHIHGYVSDLTDIYNRAEVFICPLRFGSGTKIKVLDAMYKGLPVVTTSIGAENIDFVDGENSFIADDPEEFAGKILILLNDSELWDKFSKESRKIAQEKYRRESEYQRFDKLIEEIKHG